MPKILVVDDTAVDRKIAEGILQSEGQMIVEFAENGMQALTHMETSTPDLVLTDLQMPDMDGLELVTRLSFQYPQIPVVLMTAHGSEDIAAQALCQGATSYVPKRDLASRLLETVQPILAMAEADEGYRKLIRCATRTEFSFVLDNDAAMIDPLIDLVQKVIDSMGVCEYIQRVRLGVALEQGLLNAIFRGNLEITRQQLQEGSERLVAGGQHDVVSRRRSEQPYCDRRVHVNISIKPAMAEFTIRDDGNGFDTSVIPKPGSAAAMTPDAGRGLVLMQTFMDEVHFNDRGNEVTMIKNF